MKVTEPKRPSSSKNLIGPFRRPSLPGLQQLAQGPSRPHFYQHMHVIGHHYPSQQSVTLVVKVQNRIFHYLGNLRIAQPTRAATGIKVTEVVENTILHFD